MLAAMQTGRSSIGVEVEEVYCEGALRRLGGGTEEVRFVETCGREIGPLLAASSE